MSKKRLGKFLVVNKSPKDKLSNHIELKQDNWSLGSKKKLKASIKRRLSSIFVSALDALDLEKANGSIDEETFNRLRSKILNIGNSQIRGMELELDSRYNVEFVNYHIEFKNFG